MAITVYTYNDKVLKNVATDKWLKKPDAPAGFVMNASNAVDITNNKVTWNGPNYPGYYTAAGKKLQVIVKESGCTFANLQIAYREEIGSANGPTMLSTWNNPDVVSQQTWECVPGTYTADLTANAAPDSTLYGKYLELTRNGPNLDTTQEWLSKIEFRIID